MNNSSLDKKTFNRLMGALERMKEDTRKRQEKRDFKMWSDITIPFTLRDGLSRFSKDELSDIRRQLDVKGASQLKKAELIDLLNTVIPDSLELAFKNMDYERFSLIKKVVQYGGYIENPGLLSHQLAYFRDFGILFTGTFEGKEIITMPEELVTHPFFQEQNKLLISKFRRNSEWIRLTQGLLYYYGTLTFEELLDLLEKYMGEPIERLKDYLSVMESARIYYQQFQKDEVGFSQARVFDAKSVKQEHEMRSNVDFYPFTKEQLLKAGEPDYVERNKSFMEFVRFLTQNYEISREDADTIVEECLYATNIGEEPGQILQFLQSRLEINNIEMLRAYMDQIVGLMNNSRQWFLKGYTPMELSNDEKKFLVQLPNGNDHVVDLATKKKVGRNDPCPCGSNKKYKKCCGR